MYDRVDRLVHEGRIRVPLRTVAVECHHECEIRGTIPPGVRYCGLEKYQTQRYWRNKGIARKRESKGIVDLLAPIILIYWRY